MAEFKPNSDQELREAVSILLENYWLIRDDQPEEYHLIRKYEPQLRNYFLEKCGWRLIQHPQFFKLEKFRHNRRLSWKKKA